MKVTLWGTRGSIAAPGPETIRYGGNTSCVSVECRDSRAVVVLDAGTGLRRLGQSLSGKADQIHLLLTHLHMDHIQGLGFFGPLYDPDVEVHLWGPPSPTLDLHARLSRYLSAPLFPVRLRELPCRLLLHDVPEKPFAVGPFTVTGNLVCHPGATVGFRVEKEGKSLAYIPDHEPALGNPGFPGPAEWTSGWALAREADLLLHDAQYLPEEYAQHAGWGHSTLEHCADFARLARAKRTVTFHHDPNHVDDQLDAALADVKRSRPGLDLVAGTEGAVLEV